MNNTLYRNKNKILKLLHQANELGCDHIFYEEAVIYSLENGQEDLVFDSLQNYLSFYKQEQIGEIVEELKTDHFFAEYKHNKKFLQLLEAAQNGDLVVSDSL